MLYNSHEAAKKIYKMLLNNDNELMAKIKDILAMNNKTTEQLQPCQVEINSLTRCIKLEKQDKEKIIKDINVYHCKILKVREDLMLKDNMINEVQKRSQETQHALDELQERYENVRMERNKYTNSLKET